MMSTKKKISKLKYSMKKSLITALVASVSFSEKTVFSLYDRTQRSSSKISLQVGQTG
jgi:hypothetical protein